VHSTAAEEAQAVDGNSAGARALEDSSLTAQVPSHDWGGSAMWSRATWRCSSHSASAAISVLQGIQRGGLQYDVPGRELRRPRAERLLSGGAQNLSGALCRRSQGRSPASHRAERARHRWKTTTATHRRDATGNDAEHESYPDSSRRHSHARRAALPAVLAVSFHAAYYRAFRARTTPSCSQAGELDVDHDSNPYLSAENAGDARAGSRRPAARWGEVKGTWYVAITQLQLYP